MKKINLYLTLALLILFAPIAWALSLPELPLALMSDELILTHSIKEDRIELSWNVVEAESYTLVRSRTLGEAENYEIGNIVGEYGDNYSVLEAYGAWDHFDVDKNSYIDFYPYHGTSYYAICYSTDESPWDYDQVCSLPIAVEYEGGKYTQIEDLNLKASLEGNDIVLSWDAFGQESETYHYQLFKGHSIIENTSEDPYALYYDLARDRYFDSNTLSYSEEIYDIEMSYMICAHDEVNNQCTQLLTIPPQGGDVSITDELNFKVEINGGWVDLSWDNYESDEFNRYHLVRQEIDPNTWKGEMDSAKLIQVLNESTFEHQEKLEYTGEKHFAYQICAESFPNAYCSEPISVKYAPTVIMVDHLFLQAILQPEGEILLKWNEYKPENFKHYRILRYPPEDSISMKEVLEEYGYFSSSEDESEIHPFWNWSYYSGYDDNWDERDLLDKKDFLDFAVCAYTDEDTYYCGKSVDYLDESDLPIYFFNSDIPIYFLDAEDHAYADAISGLRFERVISGYPDETFRPDELINRAEFSKIVMGDRYGLELDFKADELENCLPDVRSSWFEDVVCLAVQKQIISGYPDGLFKPEKTIVFAEAAKILALTYELPLGPEHGEWYENDIDSLEEGGHIPPSVKSPDQELTRAEMSYMVWSIKQVKGSTSLNFNYK